jgi:hypothetical protein
VNLKESDIDLTYKTEQSVNSQEVKLFFIIDHMIFEELPSLEGQVGFKTYIFASAEGKIQEAEVSALALEIHSSLPIDQGSLEAYERRLQVFLEGVRSPLTELISRNLRK